MRMGEGAETPSRVDVQDKGDLPRTDRREGVGEKDQNYWGLDRWEIYRFAHENITHAVPLRKQSTWGPMTERPRVRWSRYSSKRVPIARLLRRCPKPGPAIRHRSRPTRRSFWRPRYRFLCNSGKDIILRIRRNRWTTAKRDFSALYILRKLVDADPVELR